MKVTRFRDLTLFEIEGKKFLLACDSIGAIGAKEGDVVHVSEEVVGYFLCRVPLMELLAQGAGPDIVVLTLANEWMPTGQGVSRGVAMALEEIGIDSSMILNGSTEENIATIQTGTGITLIGSVGDDFTPSVSPAGSVVCALGLPKVGDAVMEERRDIVPLTLIRELVSLEGVNEILPVGSKGCIYEAEEMARTSGLRFLSDVDLPDWACESAGPACVVLASVSDEEILSHIELPVTRLGRLEQE